MGALMRDMARLRGEIGSLRAGRAALRADLARGAVRRRDEVAALRAGFRAAHEENAAPARAERATFVAGQRDAVARLRRSFAEDLDGSRRSWLGAAVAAPEARRPQSEAEPACCEETVAVAEVSLALPEERPVDAEMPVVETVAVVAGEQSQETQAAEGAAPSGIEAAPAAAPVPAAPGKPGSRKRRKPAAHMVKE